MRDAITKRMLKTLTAAAAAALLAAGCAGPGEVVEAPKAEAEPQNTNLICVVRHNNPQLSGRQITDAIEAGLRAVGVRTEVVDTDKIPGRCRLSLFYGITTEGDTARTFVFQLVVEGKPLQRGQGAIGPDGRIELRTIAEYAANYVQSLANASRQKRAAEDGELVPAAQ